MPFPTYAKKDEIPKGAEDVYEEKDGKFVPKLPDVAKLETTIETLRSEKKAAEKTAKEAADSVADLRRKLDIAESKGEVGAKEKKELLEKWEKDTAAAVKAVQDKLDAATGELRTIKLDAQVKKDFVDAGGRPEKADDALKLRRERFDLADDRPVVKDEKGTITTTTPRDFWAKDFKKSNPEFFKGSQATGGGAGGGKDKQPTGEGGPSAEDIIKDPLSALKKANEQAA